MLLWATSRNTPFDLRHGRRQARGSVTQSMQASFWPALNDTFTRSCCAQDMLTVRLQTPQLVSACSTPGGCHTSSPTCSNWLLTGVCLFPPFGDMGSQQSNILGERLFSLRWSISGPGQPALPVRVAVLREAYDIAKDSLAGPQYMRISLLVSSVGDRLSQVGHNRVAYRIRAVFPYHAHAGTLALGLMSE
jgi:hypothetical protein